MNLSVLTLVNNNPARDIRRITFIGRSPSAEEALLLEKAFHGSNIQKQNVLDANYNHREQDLAADIFRDFETHSGHNTAYALFSTETRNSGCIVAAKTCDNLGAPLILIQHHHNGTLDCVEIFVHNERYVISNAHLMAMGGGSAA
ncbi:MAG: hypothetical protein P4L74_01075 [Candidatus Doudnabacteria bacterium]|nr:hypothetical protein [Candidatus Doudnabacteria bacterium]